MYRKTVDELEEDKRQKLIIDIRRGEDYERETYPDAVNIFFNFNASFLQLGNNWL